MTQLANYHQVGSKTKLCQGQFRHSILGELRLTWSEHGLGRLSQVTSLEWAEDQVKRAPIPQVFVNALHAHADGRGNAFEKLVLNPKGTSFQLSVWRELLLIPWGDTCSYKELASRLGSPNACRAVGNANASNPIPLIIPCHRVITSSGKLGGYALGADLKRKLLEFEGVAVS